MGTLRFILAVAVATNHAGFFWGYAIYPAVHSVQIFYIVSGFLMTLILNEKYGPDRLWLFYSNRVLRIHVPYLFVYAVALALVWPLAVMFGKLPTYAAPLFENAAKFDWATWAYLAFSSVAIIGQDIGLWLGFDGQHLFVTKAFLEAPVPLTWLQLIPPAWTISLELTFYLIAPFIVRRNVLVLIGGVLGCYALRIIGHEFGMKYAFWNYRFFPFELAYFLSGAVGYHLWARTRHWPIWRGPVCVGVSLAVLAIVLLWVGVEHQRALYAFMALVMPFLFLAGKRFRFDRWLGELSYPIYLMHWPLQSILALAVGSALPLAVWSIPATITAAALFVVFVDRPLDRMRQRRLRGEGGRVPRAASDRSGVGLDPAERPSGIQAIGVRAREPAAPG